jgi:PAS domain S-box-containing protein
MQNEMHELFLLAARFFYRKYKKNGGSQGELARKLGITNSYLSSVISGSRKASLELQDQIANIFLVPYDKFLAIGRRIKEGLEPLEEQPISPVDSVEKLLSQLTFYIMDHKRIEKELELSKEKYRDISLTTGDMIFEMNQDFEFVFVAGRVEEVTGRKPIEIIGKKYSDFYEDSENQRLKELIQHAIQKRSILDTVITVLVGNERYYRHLIAKPLFDSGGKFIGSRGTYRDITRRKRLEQALEQQNWLLQVAIDTVDHCGFVISDADNKVLKWNMEYKRLFNHSDELLKTRDTMKYIAETRGKTADPEQYDRDVKQVLRSRKSMVHTYQLLDGKVIERKVIPLFKDNVLIGRIAHIRNIANEK